MGTGSKTWNVALWIVQVLLAELFLMAGSMKATAPMADLVAKMGWPGDVPPWLVRFIGASEMAGALGLLLPAATRILPALTPLAAVGLTTVMTLAALFHLSRGEAKAMSFALIRGAASAFVAWGRFRKAPIAARAGRITRSTAA